MDQGRRAFLRASLAGSLATQFGFLSDISHAAAGSIEFQPGAIRFGTEIDALVRLIHATPRDACVPVFLRRFESGLTYQQFLTALFQAATQTGDLHQIAQIYGAHRTASRVPIEQRLLPAFWALDRVKRGQDLDRRMRSLDGSLPESARAESALRDAMDRHDPDLAERAVVAVARAKGGRYAMHRLWDAAPRNLSQTLGHLPIGVASSWRTLEAIGWEHAEPALRYMAIEISRFRGDGTFGPNMDRVAAALAGLPGDWAATRADRAFTLELFGLLRAGQTDDACDLVVSSLVSGRAKAGAAWDAISLAASEVLFRHRTGGNVIGGNLVHAVTSTNALRFGFDLRQDDRTRLLCLLQAAGATADYFVGATLRAGRLRDMHLIEDLDASADLEPVTYEQIFATLPVKGDSRGEEHPDERLASDRACGLVFANIQSSGADREFERAASGYLVSKAFEDPHDIKFPMAAFEDASKVSPQWRPYLLAASVHALHGSQSPDNPILARARASL